MNVEYLRCSQLQFLILMILFIHYTDFRKKMVKMYVLEFVHLRSLYEGFHFFCEQGSLGAFMKRF